MSDRWVKYFTKEKGNYQSLLAYSINHWLYNDPLYSRIKQLVKVPAKILDVGCGLGLSAIYLQESGYEVVGVDNEGELITEAVANAEYFHSRVKYELSDAFNLAAYAGQFDLVYSVGLVEHFDRHVTIDLIREQAKCAPYVITVIPTRFTKYSGKITDERIYNIFQLKKLFAEAGLTVIDQFGYGNISSPLHNLIYSFLPHGAYRIFQNYFSYAMDIVCIGRKK